MLFKHFSLLCLTFYHLAFGDISIRVLGLKPLNHLTTNANL